MLFNVALLSSLLLVPAVLAVPSALVGSRVARRRDGRQSQANKRIEQRTTAVSNTIYNDGWAGAIVSGSDGTFTSVTGTFTVPTPSGQPGAYAAIWVGIDGVACGGLLQTGITIGLSSNGQPEYSAWYEWYPEGSIGFSDMDISAGDIVKLTVTSSSATSGNAMIENRTSGQTVSQDLTSNTALCGQTAEWIVEDFVAGNSQVTFANFGNVIFTGAMAGTYSPPSATTVDIEQNNQVLTSTTISGSSITIRYVGE